MQAAVHQAFTGSPVLQTTRPRGLNPRPASSSSATVKHSSTSSISSSASVCDALLDWADALDGSQRPVAIQHHSEYGRCLVATEEIPIGTVLLSVPLEQVFQSQSYEDLELHWAAEMALRLLQAQHASSSSSNSSKDASAPAFWGPWVESLPPKVVTPVEFTTQEVEQLVIPSTVQAVMDARESLEGCFEVLQPDLDAIGATWQDFLWAVQVLHSRCFFEGTAARHMAVPGVDMCNHSHQPNAAVRLVHSPAACQGLDALEEVAPVAAAAACPSYFQLVADTSVRNLPQSRTTSDDALRMLMRPTSIQAGDQVTISYGPWPTEPLLLLFGFVPQHNPHDSLALFSDLQHMAECWQEMLTANNSTTSSRSSSDAADKADMAASAAVAGALGSMLADPTFAQLLQEQLSIQEGAAADGVQQQVGRPPGFRDLALSVGSASDVRLSSGLQVLQTAVGAAVQEWHSHHQQQQQQQEQHVGQLIRDLKGGVSAVVRYRLQQLAQQLEASAAAAAAVHTSSSGRDEETEQVDEFITYGTSSEHRSLIGAYCSSKAELAKQLLAKV